MDNSGNNGRRFYMRPYLTGGDVAHNQSGAPGRARSGSMGQIDDQGNRTERFHFHALGGHQTLITSRPDAGPHGKSEWKRVKVSDSPMTVPGAIKWAR